MLPRQLLRPDEIDCDFHLRHMPPTSDLPAAAWRHWIGTAVDLIGPQYCMFGYVSLWNAWKQLTAIMSAAGRLPVQWHRTEDLSHIKRK